MDSRYRTANSGPGRLCHGPATVPCYLSPVPFLVACPRSLPLSQSWGPGHGGRTQI